MSNHSTSAALPIRAASTTHSKNQRPTPADARRRRTIAVALALATVAAVWLVRSNPPYTPGSTVGYALGLAGGMTLLALLLYPARKHLRFMQEWGRLRYWFMAHMFGGVLGPVLILFHSTFRVGSFNATVALGSMLLVVASGLVGRFLYRRIHHGLYGRRSSLEEAREALERQLRETEPALRGLPLLRETVEQYVGVAAAEHSRLPQRAIHLAALGPRRVLAWRRIRRAARAFASRPVDQATSRESIARLLYAIDGTLRAAQQAAQFSSYERLFALWHAVHVPFLCMLVITAILHVVAVHAY